MLRVNELRVERVVNVPAHADMQDGVLYYSEKYGSVIHLCACGCRQKTVTPPDQGWVVTFNEKDEVTIRASIGNYQLPCRSHYWVTNNRIEWL